MDSASLESNLTSWSYYSPAHGPVADDTNCFDIDREDEGLIVEPVFAPSDIDSWRLEAEIDKVLEVRDWTDSPRIIFDLSSCSTDDSAALVLFVALSKRPELQRHLVRFACLTPQQENELRRAGMLEMWPSFRTLQEALTRTDAQAEESECLESVAGF